jgi:hypothetical protein
MHVVLVLHPTFEVFRKPVFQNLLCLAPHNIYLVCI